MRCRCVFANVLAASSVTSGPTLGRLFSLGVGRQCAGCLPFSEAEYRGDRLSPPITPNEIYDFDSIPLLLEVGRLAFV